MMDFISVRTGVVPVPGVSTDIGQQGSVTQAAGPGQPQHSLNPSGVRADAASPLELETNLCEVSSFRIMEKALPLSYDLCVSDLISCLLQGITPV